MTSMSLLSGFPAISEVARKLEIASRAPFGGCRVLAVQHLHSSILPLLEAVCLGGVPLRHVSVVGKSYSSRPQVVQAIGEYGMNVVDPLRMLDPHRSYEAELAETVGRVLDDLDAERRRGAWTRLLVIDEGAVATRAMSRRPELARHSAVVEQTTRGARWLDDRPLTFPAVDVARSAAKATHEGPLIARSMMDGLRLALAELGRDLSSPPSAGVVGYGRMGARLAGLLRVEGFQVTVHDADAERQREAGADGHRTCAALTELLDAVDLLVGCTGDRVLGQAELARATRPLLLASCASSDIEYEVWPARTAGAIAPCSPYPADQPWRNHYALGPGGRHVLLAGGFPMNFFCPGEPISPQEFQITRALMLAGLTQAAALPAPGPTPLDPELQRIVTTAYGRAMAESSAPVS